MKEQPQLNSGEPPLLSLNFFYHQFSRAGKRLFLVAFGLMLVTTAVLLIADANPAEWALEVQPDILSEKEPVVLETVTNNYRDVNIVADASFSFTSYGVGLISPADWMVWMLVIGLCAGWSLLFTAASRMESFFLYATYFVYIIFIYSTNITEMLFQHPSIYLVLIPSGVFVGLSYMFKTQTIHLRMFWQFLLFFGLHLLLVAIIYGSDGLLGVHQFATYGQSILLVFTVLFVLMCSTTLPSVILFITTSAKDKKERLAPQRIFILLFLMSILLIIVALATTGYIGDSWLLFSPVYLLALGAILLPFTVQNTYHQVKDLITTNLAFTVGVVAVGLIGMSILAYDIMVAEMLVRFVFHKAIAVVFAAVAVGYCIYLFGNYYSLLQLRVNIYYLVMKPVRVRFVAVWFMALFLWLGEDGMNRNWITYRTVRMVSSNQRADNAMLAGRFEDKAISYKGLDLPGNQGALTYYENSLNKLRMDPKANFNAAGLKIGRMKSIGKGEQAISVIRHYELSALEDVFPYSTINCGRFMAQAGYTEDAKLYLNRYLRKFDNEHIATNLAAIHYYTEDPDSAIIALKKALAINMDNGRLYANMATVYHKYNRPEQAIEFARAGFELDDEDPAVLQNYAFMALRYGEKLDGVLDTELEDLDIYPQNAVLNQAMAAYKLGQVKKADELTGRLINRLASKNLVLPEAYIMKLATLARLDSVNTLSSRYKYLYDFQPQTRAQASHIMGVFYYRKDALHTARHYFRQAAKEGQEVDQLMAAFATLDMGKHELGYSLLQDTIVIKQYNQMITEELAILDSVYGIPAYYIAWDFSNITMDQAYRMAAYSGKLGKLHIATRALELIVQNDKKTVEPYLLMGKLFMQQGEYKVAIEQYDAGLKRDKNNTELLKQKALTQLKLGNKESARKVMDVLKSGQAYDQVQAAYTLVEGDTTKAIKQLAKYVSAYPYDKSQLELLATLYDKREKPQEAYQTYSKVLVADPLSPEVLRQYAYYAYKIGFNKDAEESLRQAIALVRSDQEDSGALEQELQQLELKIQKETEFDIE